MNLIREIKGYFWGEGDVPKKRDDHSLDELRYYLMTKPKNAPPLPQPTALQRDKMRLMRPRGEGARARIKHPHGGLVREGECVEEERVRRALERKALGYETDEVVEEYGFREGEEILVKKKVTRKSVPPDIQAAKMLLGELPSPREMSDEQIEREKHRLLQMLKEEEN